MASGIQPRALAGASLSAFGHMALPEDIIAKVRRDFPEDDAIAIIQLMSELQKREPDWLIDRVLRCVVFVANGSFDKFIGAIYTDPKDLIVTAEYDGWYGEENRLRDFERPFVA